MVAKGNVAVGQERVDEDGPDGGGVGVPEPRVHHQRVERRERPAPQVVVGGALHAVEQARHHGRQRVRRLRVRKLLPSAAGLLRGGGCRRGFWSPLVRRRAPCPRCARFKDQVGQAFARLVVAVAVVEMRKVRDGKAREPRRRGHYPCMYSRPRGVSAFFFASALTGRASTCSRSLAPPRCGCRTRALAPR